VTGDSPRRTIGYSVPCTEFNRYRNMGNRSFVSQSASYRDIGEFWDAHDATEFGADDAVEIDVEQGRCVVASKPKANMGRRTQSEDARPDNRPRANGR
jgi:hypothetical protein